ncbi:MAG: helix-turn-helix transcriptional regulator [Rhodopila sp.]
MRRSSIDHWIITLRRQGDMHLNTNGRAVRALASVPFLWSLSEPSLCLHSQTERLQLILSCDAFHGLGPLLDGMRGIAFDLPLGSMLGDYIVALNHRLPMLNERDVPQVMAATAAMITAAVDPARRERVRRAVREHLRLPSLTPAVLCRIAGVSRSDLYRLLEDVGGAARYIQSRRLAEAHAVLSDLNKRKCVTSIAQELCFSDASSFSWAFRREFGYSPSDLAACAAAGRVPRSRDSPDAA